MGPWLPDTTTLRVDYGAGNLPAQLFGLWAVSSAGRARAWHARGHRFKSGTVQKIRRVKYRASMALKGSSAQPQSGPSHTILANFFKSVNLFQ